MNNRTVLPRNRSLKQSVPVFRTPWEISDLAYKNFAEKAHRAKLTGGTAHFANRLIREESFTKEELRALKAIINGDEETSSLSGYILGADDTLAWIEAALKGELKPYGYAAARP
jgi:hypothetical protein